MRSILYFTASMMAIMPTAMAQNPQTTTPANPTVPVAPPNAPSPPPEQIAPPAGGSGTMRPGGNLSNTLSRQRGTIPPPNVDPGISVRPPASGQSTTPVIPPPGAPGGNPSVVPK